MSFRFPASHSRLYLALAGILFIALWTHATSRIGVISEEVMVHTSSATERLAESQSHETLLWDASCQDEPAPLTLVERRRPNFSLCFNGRKYPIVIASYMSGYFYWPLALFAGFHHDNALNLRWFSMFLGLIDILLTYLVLRRLGKPALAAVAALAIAVMPTFVVVHTLLVHFETLPWTFTMAGLFVLAGSADFRKTSGDATLVKRGVSTSRLAGGAFFFGLAVAANLKVAFVLGPIALLAVRLGAPIREIKPKQWAWIALFAIIPLIPMIWFALSHPHMFLAGDKSGGMFHTLWQNIRRPGLWLERTQILLHFWANVGDYVAGQASLLRNPVASFTALIAFVFVIVDTARTLIRGRGDVVTAACGLFFLSHIAMLTLLVRSFPISFVPLHAVFGCAIACLVLRLWRSKAVESITKWLRWGQMASLLALSLMLTAPYAVASVRTSRAFYNLPILMSRHAQDALVAHLTASEPAQNPGRLVSIEDLLNGVVESLSNGRVKVMQAEDLLRRCRQSGNHHADAGQSIDECWVSTFRQLISSSSARPLRFLLSADNEHLHLGDDDGEAALKNALSKAAAELNVPVTSETTFQTALGLTVLELYRID